METIDLFGLLLAALTAVASGMVGAFALMRRMALAGDALSHVALPGIGLALLYGINPVLGGAFALVLGVIIIWKIEKISGLNIDAVIGVLFSLSLAAGAIAIEDEHELMEALFGSSLAITFYEFLAGAIIALGVIGFIIKERRSLVLSLVSKELARTADIKTDRLQLYFLLAFALTVILGLKFLGALLMGSLIIIPAAAARNIAQNLNSMLVLSSLAALASVLAGFFISNAYSVALGPAIISISGAFFFLTLFWRRN